MRRKIEKWKKKNNKKQPRGQKRPCHEIYGV